tara:strand:- start:154 stop:609 length:456 start_codon:yes stop_codon:yes gene_type:complete
MEIILLEKVDNVGALGDKVIVKSGFARNYLIPTGKAVFASEENLAAYEARRAELEKQEAEKLSAAQARKKQIESLNSGITIKHQAGEEGKLFGSVGTGDIVSALAEHDIQVIKSEIRMPQGVFREIGQFNIVIHLHTDVDVDLTINIIAEI